MTRKDYELIAVAISNALFISANDQERGISNVAKYIATALQRDNPEFKRDKFLDACGFATKDSWIATQTME